MNLDQLAATITPPVAIAVPVRDEVDHLPNLLTALAAQRQAPPFTLCLFLDNCTDGSVDVVDAMAARLPYPLVTECCDFAAPANAGRARGRAAALALTIAPHGILLTTDADSEPAPDWIAANVSTLERADIVAGRISLGLGSPSAGQDRVEHYLNRLHAVRRAIDPVDWEDNHTHHWTSAASLAMHADTYRAIGGFAPVACGEDAALGDAATRQGYRIRRDARVVVKTSARRDGRAEGGFADSLAMLDGASEPSAVTHPGDEAWRFSMQAAARLLHSSGSYESLARNLGLSSREVEQVAGECRNGEAFAARIVGVPASGMRMVELGDAERLLAALEKAPLVRAA